MKRVVIFIMLFLVIGCTLLCLLLAHAPGNWRQVSLSFGGYTNSMAVISIHNRGQSAVVLRDKFGLEFVGVAPYVSSPGYTNLLRYPPTGTNLVVEPSGSASFFIPIPYMGQRWIARLQFAPAGLRTRIGE